MENSSKITMIEVNKMAQISNLNLIRAHLSSLGYVENVNDGVYSYEHPEKTWMALAEENGGLMVTTAFKGADDYNPDDPELLSIINRLNQETMVSSFTAMDEYTVCKAWYYGEYSQQKFQNFYNLWENDVNLFLDGIEEDINENELSQA